MARSSTSSRSSSRSSNKSSNSRGSSVTIKSTAVDLPQKCKALSLVLWCAGADPRRIRHLRKDEIAYDNADWDGSSRSGFSSRFGGDSRTKTKWVFVSDTYADYYYYNYGYGSNADDESTFSGRSKSKRSSPSRQSSRGSAGPRDGPGWQNRGPPQRGGDEDYSDSDSDSSEDSDGQYGGPIPPPPPMHAGMPMGGPPPAGFYNIPPQGAPPPPQQPPPPFVPDEDPGFFQIR